MEDPNCPFCREEMEYQSDTHLFANHAWICAHCGAILLMPRTVDGYRGDGTFIYEAVEL